VSEFRCPVCKSSEHLFVVSLHMHIMGVPLDDDGYDLWESKMHDTDNETVECRNPDHKGHECSFCDVIEKFRENEE
jgi:hypothetical protein